MQPIKINVLVDLKRGKAAGGHVKCWERFGGAAVDVPEIDLTVHFLGDEPETDSLSANVRFVTHRPVLSTARLRLKGMPGETDIAARNHSLDGYLEDCDVIHTTDTYFAMARTGLWHARHRQKPLVTSIHTDVPEYSRIFTAKLLRGLRHGQWLGNVLLRWFRVHELLGAFMQGRLRRYLRHCDWVLSSRPDDLGGNGNTLPNVSRLRRGIDKDAFNPGWRDRNRLQREFGVKPDRFTILFVGRIDEGKDVKTLARAVRRLLDRGLPVHLLLVGKGALEGSIRRLLGGAATFAGVQDPPSLAWIYASADVFAFPSRSEVFPNVVSEAKASGLPVLVSSEGGSAQLIDEDGVDGLRLANNAAVWGRAIETLLGDPARLAAMRQEARRSAEKHCPSWREVLEQDLLPVWLSLARKKHGGLQESLVNSGADSHPGTSLQ